METETKTPEQIVEALAADGWAMVFTCLNPGDYKTQSDWTVTIIRNGRPFSTKYHKGSAHRRWTKGAKFIDDWKGQFAKAPKAGERVPSTGYRRASLRQDEVLRKYTEPIPPTLDEVLYCLTLDASGSGTGNRSRSGPENTATTRIAARPKPVSMPAPTHGAEWFDSAPTSTNWMNFSMIIDRP